MKRRPLILILWLLASVPAAAQFYQDGSDPGGLRWWSIDSPHFRIIYPEGLDSLARVYGGLLERYQPVVGISDGMTPGEGYRRRTDVVLHAWNGFANGSVTWTPKRMDFFTVPDALRPDPFPWEKSLAIHESRHLAQMQLGYRRVLKPFSWLLGEMAPGAVAGLYPGPHLLEGDAVVAETALTRYGRGRSGDFLGYYMAAFDRGDWRNWHRWRWGSYRHYAPNHYALGYMTIAGTRVMYDDPLFMSRYFDHIARRPWRIGNMQREVKAASGKRFRDSFSDIMHFFHDGWEAEAIARKPFMDYSLVGDIPGWYTAVSGVRPGGDGLVFTRNSLLETDGLFTADASGALRRLTPLGNYPSAPRIHGDRIWWSEVVPDLRWEKKMSVRIRYMDPDGRPRFLTRQGRFYNPAPSPDGTQVAAVEYPVAGGSAIVVLDMDGNVVLRLRAPDGLQYYDVEWFGAGLAAAAISEPGEGLYQVDENGPRVLLAPQPVSLHALSRDGDKLLFTSDRTGVSEVYQLDGQGTLRQLTATKYGASDGAFRGDTLYFTAHTADGRLLARSTDLPRKAVSWSDIHPYPVADRLSVQEAALGATPEASPKVVHLEAPQRYRKVPHIPNFHSWAPLYINYDAFSALNVQTLTSAASVGVTGFFQNVLGTASGSVAYAFKPDALGGRGWRHSGHLKFSYNGLYPVFEVSLDVNDRAALQYVRRSYIAEDIRIEQVGYQVTGRPLVSGSLSAYVPLNLSSGGWRRGITPRVRLSLSNDRYDKSEVALGYKEALEGSSFSYFMGYSQAPNVLMGRLDLSVAGYVMSRKTEALEYPRLGIGGEVGWHGRPGMTDLYSAGVYGYLYGYLPGALRNHGTRLSALYQHLFGDGVVFGENTVNAIPRGMGETGLMQYLALSSTDQLRLTVDYALPFWVGDISWFSPVTYITHFVFTPHADYTFFWMDGQPGGLYSAGFDLSARLAHLAWLPYPASLGVTFDWTGGPSAAALRESGVLPERRWYIGLIFNVDL